MEKLKLNGKTFVPYIPYRELGKDIDAVAEKINADFSGRTDIPVILTVLNGAIMFTAELMRRLEFDCELMSIKLTSYSGTHSTGTVKVPMGLTGSVKGRSVIVVEDIVDTGGTIVFLDNYLREQGASEVKVCTMLLKSDVYDKDIAIDYVAREIPNRFILGFGLDYDEIGRNYKDIYVLDEDDDKQHTDMKYFILFGPPGAGKGTQAGAISTKYGLRHISTGELLRSEMAAGTEFGNQAKALINAGAFVPDEVVNGMIKSAFENTRDVNGFLLDGYPRTLAQAEALDAMLAERGEEVTGVVSLMIPDETVHERIKHRATVEGRADDADDAVISNRIHTYHANTEPLIAYYKEAGKYFEIDGSGTIEEVHDNAITVMDKLTR